MTLQNSILAQLQLTQKASKLFNTLAVETINELLLEIADEAEKQTPTLLAENQKDLELMDPADPKYDRLKLTAERIKGITADIRNVATLEYPVGRTLMQKNLPNGLAISKVTVPLGVVGVIYESRPNVTFDVFSLCLKSGNACVLKGSRDAAHSNQAISQLITQVLERHGINKHILYLMPPDREATEVLLKAVEYIDVLIPRGSQGLIDYVRSHAKVPVIETGAGIVHTYFDASGDLEKGIGIIDNAKTRRVSVCNALDCLIIHQSRLFDLLAITTPLAKKGVTIYADAPAYNTLQSSYPAPLLQLANEESYGTEFLSLTMSIKTVGSLGEALEHISNYSSKHSEAIIAEDTEAIETFLNQVDAAAVYANASTAFTDGAQFGLGAEIGISTQKIHARGPMGLAELTSYKWVVKGNGQVRNP